MDTVNSMVKAWGWAGEARRGQWREGGEDICNSLNNKDLKNNNKSEQREKEVGEKQGQESCNR